jgi:hypothetical protein
MCQRASLSPNLECTLYSLSPWWERYLCRGALQIFAPETGPNTLGCAPSLTGGRACPAGAGEGALATKSTLSLALSHWWERGQIRMCSALFAGQKSVARLGTGISPTSGRGEIQRFRAHKNQQLHSVSWVGLGRGAHYFPPYCDLTRSKLLPTHQSTPPHVGSIL